MKFGDVFRLKRCLLVFSALLLVSALLSAWTFERQQKAKEAQFAAQNARDALRTKFAQIKGQWAEIKEAFPIFERLTKAGILGEENRLAWVELLKELSQDSRSIDLKFEFAPQQKLNRASGDDMGEAGDNVSFYRSRLSARMTPLHEGYFFAFIDALTQRAPALIDLQSCELSSLSALSSLNPNEVLPLRLFADCQIDWITLVIAPEKLSGEARP